MGPAYSSVQLGHREYYHWIVQVPSDGSLPRARLRATEAQVPTAQASTASTATCTTTATCATIATYATCATCATIATRVIKGTTATKAIAKSQQAIK